jgi:hypothetical protein
MVQPVQFAIRPGGTTKRITPVNAIPIKDSAASTEANARQLNCLLISLSIILPFS